MHVICLLTATLLALPALVQDNTPINEVVLDRQAHPTLVGPRALQPDCPVSWCAPLLGTDLGNTRLPRGVTRTRHAIGVWLFGD